MAQDLGHCDALRMHGHEHMDGVVMRALLGLLALLIASPALAQYLPFKTTVEGGGGGVPYTNVSLNVFDTLDPAASTPELIASNGFVFVDGFEDGVWIDLSVNAGCDGVDPATCACWPSMSNNVDTRLANDYWMQSGALYDGLHYGCEDQAIDGGDYR